MNVLGRMIRWSAVLAALSGVGGVRAQAPVPESGPSAVRAVLENGQSRMTEAVVPQSS